MLDSIDYALIITVLILKVISTNLGRQLLAQTKEATIRFIVCIVNFVPMLRETIPLLYCMRVLSVNLVREMPLCKEDFMARAQDIIDRFSHFYKTSGLKEELARGFLRYNSFVNFILLFRIHQRKARTMSLREFGPDHTDQTQQSSWFKQIFVSRPSSTELPHEFFPTITDAHRTMKFATTGYGVSMVNAVLQERRTSMAVNALTSIQETLCRHNSVCQQSAILVNNQHGNLESTQHILALDHARKQAVLTIRGTFSLADCLIDMDIPPVEFCGGFAPAGFSRMATSIWNSTKIAIETQIPDDYKLIVTGHSLGGGVAMLFTLKVLHEKLVSQSKIHCFSFGGPPVFDGPFSKVANNITAFTHQDDFIPSFSSFSTRQLNAEIVAVDQERKNLSWFQLFQGMWCPSSQLTQALDNMEALEPLNLVRKFQIPASQVIWLHKKGTNGQYRANVISAEKLSSQRGILLTDTMISDHLPAKYETAFLQLCARRDEIVCAI